MDAGLLDVLHDRGDVRLGPVAERVDVDLDRVLEEPVDEDAPVHRHELHLVVACNRCASSGRRGRTTDG